jgi:crotonobetainyl-CoA:carnitine CoA-transferase CaiB-like acyl-CoA transferase
MGEPELGTDERYDTMAKRSERRADVDARVIAWTSSHSRDDLCRILDETEVPNSPINSMADCFADPHYQARETLMPFADPQLGEVPVHAPVPRLSTTPMRVPRPAPSPGEHNAEIYGELAGLSTEELATLEQRGVV